MEFSKIYKVLFSVISLYILTFLGFFLYFRDSYALVSLFFSFIFPLTLVVAMSVLIGRMMMKVLLKRVWGRPTSVFVSTLFTGLSFLLFSFIALNLLNLGSDDGMGLAVFFLIVSIPLVLVAIWHYFSIIFYRLDKNVPVGLKTVITIGDTSSDNKFSQVIMFLLIYVFVLFSVVAICVGLLFFVSDLMQGPPGYTETIDGQEYFHPY